MQRRMLTRLFFFISLLAAGLVVPLPANAAPDPVNCTGYPEWRTFIESQAWWSDDTAPFPGRHVHMATCFPLHQTVSGTIHFDLKIQAHNIPGPITKIAVQTFNNGAIQEKAVNLDCQVTDCTWWVGFDFDSTKTTYNGKWEFRLRAIVPDTPSGDKIYNSTRWFATLDNPGKPYQDTSQAATRTPGGAGWYTAANYLNVYCGYNDSGYNLVRNPVSGTVQVKCRFDRQTAFASIDPSFHADPPNEGTVLLDTTGGTYTININTTTLPNGIHKLFLRTDATIANPVGTASGVQVLQFNVQN